MELWNRLVVFFLLIFGFLVGAVVIYRASIEGLYKSMGLSESSYSNMVDLEKMVSLINEYPADEVKCGLRGYFTGYFGYRNAEGLDKGVRAYVLGERRVICGTRDVIKGDIESGTYEIYKGLGYLKSGEEILGDRVCEIEERKALLDSLDRSSWYLSSYMDSTRGSLREIVGREYLGLAKSWRELSCVDSLVF